MHTCILTRVALQLHSPKCVRIIPQTIPQTCTAETTNFLLPCIIVTKHNTASTCSTYHRSHQNTVAREVLLGIVLIDKGFIIAVHELEVHSHRTVWLARTDSGTQFECWNFGMSSKLGQKEGEVLYM